MSASRLGSTHRSRARRVSLAGALLAAWLGAMPSAWAQTEEDRATARQLAIDGNAALERKDYTTAADKFGRADALFHAPTLLLGLARAQAGLGKLVAARDSYQRVVREGVPPGGSKIFIDAVEDAKKELAALEPRVPWVTLLVSGAPDPTVTLDNAALLPSALSVKRPIDPGPHSASAMKNGFLTAERGFTMREGQTETIVLQLYPAGGVEMPAVAADPTPPSHVDSASSPGSGATLRTLGVVALVIGGVGVVAGGITGGLAIKEHSLLDRDCDDGECPEERRSTLDNFRALSTVSTVGFIAGGVFLAGGATMLILGMRSETTKAGVIPYLGPAEAGLTGRF